MSEVEVKPTDEVVVSPTPEEKPKFESGMTRQINFAKAEKPTNGENKETKPAEKPVFDYTPFKDLTEDDYKKYAHLKDKDEATYHELLSNRNDMKKNQRLVSAREQELNQFKNQKPDEKLAKYEEFMNGMKTDALGTYKRFQKDFGLPDVDFLEQQVSSGTSTQDRLKQFQEVELIPSIEKKFKLESGTFLYDANEAYKAGTPSYEYRLQTEGKEKLLNSEYETSKTRQTEIVSKVKQQTDADMKFLRETYFPDSNYESPEKADEAFVQHLSVLDTIQEQIKTGEFDAEKSPFALRHIFRGVNFDSIMKTALDKQAKEIHAEYNQKGLYLQKNDLPTDVKKIGSSNPPDTTYKDNKKGITSPMYRRINQSFINS